MPLLNRELLRIELKQDEGVRLKPYVDTVGKITIGVGRNLTDVGISLVESDLLLEHDIDRAFTSLLATFPWTAELDPVRQSVLLQMVFNMGPVKLEKFVQTLAAVKHGNYQEAAAGMLNSLWASQVGLRAVRLAAQMETGNEP